MKAMDKVRRGKNFKGVIMYALRPDKKHKTSPVVIGGNMAGTTAEKLIKEFNRTKTLRPDVAKAVWHTSLRLPYGDTMTNEQWSEIADDYMRRMGFNDTHLRTYILHDDNEGQHIHIIASRIDLDGGKLYLGKNENLISTRITQELERDYNLTRTQGPKPARQASPPKPKKLSRNEEKMEECQGEQSPKSAIQSALEALLAAGKPDTTEFIQQLAGENIRAIPNIATTGRMNGFSFEYAGIAFKASQLGKGYSWSELQNKIDYQPERDNAYLLALKYPVVNEASVEEEGNYASPASAISKTGPATIEVTATEHTQKPTEAPARQVTLAEELAQIEARKSEVKKTKAPVSVITRSRKPPTSPAPAIIESVVTEQTLDQEPLTGTPERKMTIGEMLAQFTKALKDATSRKIDELDTIKRETPASAKESSPSSKSTTPGIDSFAGLAATPDLSSLSTTASAKQRKTTASKPTGVDESKMSIGEMLIYLDEKRDAKKRLKSAVTQARNDTGIHQSRHFLQGRWLLWIPYLRKILHLLKERGANLVHTFKPFDKIYKTTPLEEEGVFGSSIKPQAEKNTTDITYSHSKQSPRGHLQSKFK